LKGDNNLFIFIRLIRLSFYLIGNQSDNNRSKPSRKLNFIPSNQIQIVQSYCYNSHHKSKWTSVIQKVSEENVINKCVYNLNKLNTFLYIYIWKFGRYISLLCCCKKELYITGLKGNNNSFLLD